MKLIGTFLSLFSQAPASWFSILSSLFALVHDGIYFPTRIRTKGVTWVLEVVVGVGGVGYVGESFVGPVRNMLSVS